MDTGREREVASVWELVPRLEVCVHGVLYLVQPIYTNGIRDFRM